MNFALSLLLLPLVAASVAQAEPIPCESVKAGNEIIIQYGSEPLYDLDSAPGLARLWGGKVGFDETTILHPYALKHFDLPEGQTLAAHVLRDGFLATTEAGGVDHASCNIVVRIGDKNILLRKSRFGHGVEQLKNYVTKLDNIQVFAQPAIYMSQSASIADLNFNGAAR